MIKMHALFSHTVFGCVEKLCRSNRSLRFLVRGFGCALFYFQEDEKMKKFLAVIFAVIMLLSFAACGGEAAGKVNLEELLVAEKWICIYDRNNTLQFDIGNYGEEVYFGNSSVSFEWEIIDNESVIGKTHFFGGTQETKYIYTEYEGTKSLYNPVAKEYYVQESVYDGIRENLAFPTHIAVATVTFEDGTKDVLTAEELGFIYSVNSNKYYEDYDDAKVSVVGEITEIGSWSVTIGGNGNRWIIHDLNLNYDLSKFEIGDVVVATGIIEDAFASSVDVKGKTTIKLYEG